MTNKAHIKEVFTSIQGEGPFVGAKQVFVRFCGCNLNCSYCDTDFDINGSKLYSVEELLSVVNNCSSCNSVSLTGGEPLLNSEFLIKFLPKCTLPVYLETNATLPDKLLDVIKYVDYVSADIKLPSCSGVNGLWGVHDKFFSIASEKTLFAKIVFNEKITDEEIDNSIKIAEKYGIEIILQPICQPNIPDFDVKMAINVLDRFLIKYKNVKLIPQVHKFLNIR